jgi:hypothetical protein
MWLFFLGFSIGGLCTMWIFNAEIYHGRKIGYGENDIHPDNGLGCCRSVPPAQYKPHIVPPSQYGTQPRVNAKRGQGITPPPK